MEIRTLEEAKRSIQLDAVTRARAYLEREAPNTLPAIEFWVNEKQWDYDKIMDEFDDTYGITEEKTQHKIRLMVEHLVRERDE